MLGVCVSVWRWIKNQGELKIFMQFWIEAPYIYLFGNLHKKQRWLQPYKIQPYNWWPVGAVLALQECVWSSDESLALGRDAFFSNKVGKAKTMRICHGFFCRHSVSRRLLACYISVSFVRSAHHCHIARGISFYFQREGHTDKCRLERYIKAAIVLLGK